MSEIKAVQIFHAVASPYQIESMCPTPREAAKVYKAGGYYMAGVVRVDLFGIEDNRVPYLMDQAYIQSQNDNYPNPEIETADGSFVPGPAEWNGLFAQRSSAVGDIFVQGKHHFLVTGTGFEAITLPKNAKHTENPYLPDFAAYDPEVK